MGHRCRETDRRALLDTVSFGGRVHVQHLFNNARPCPMSRRSPAQSPMAARMKSFWSPRPDNRGMAKLTLRAGAGWLSATASGPPRPTQPQRRTHGFLAISSAAPRRSTASRSFRGRIHLGRWHLRRSAQRLAKRHRLKASPRGRRTCRRSLLEQNAECPWRQSGNNNSRAGMTYPVTMPNGPLTGLSAAACMRGTKHVLTITGLRSRVQQPALF